jgi:hypothetical protein
MPIFKIYNSKLNPIKEKQIDLEKYLQALTEKNLQVVFGLEFISGFLNREFSIKAAQQDFYIDTFICKNRPVPRLCLEQPHCTLSYLVILLKLCHCFSLLHLLPQILLRQKFRDLLSQNPNNFPSLRIFSSSCLSSSSFPVLGFSFRSAL